MKRRTGFYPIVLLCAVLAACFVFAFQSNSETSATSKEQDVIDILTTAKTAVWFTDEEIPEEHIKQILMAGLNAPSAVNVQPWHFSVVTNKKILAEIYEGTFASLPPGYMEELLSMAVGIPPTPESIPRRVDLIDTQVAIFVYMDDVLPPWNAFDCGLATEAMSVAALSLGYGTKIVGLPTFLLNGEKKAYYDELLQVPEGYSFIVALLIGHNDESIDIASAASTRYPMEQKVRFIR